MKNEPTCKKERMLFIVTHYANTVWRLANPDGTTGATGIAAEYAVYPTRDEAEKKVEQMRLKFPAYAESYKVVPIFARVFDEDGRDRPEYEDGWNDTVRESLGGSEAGAMEDF